MKGHDFSRAVNASKHTRALKRNQSKRALVEGVQGGFFLRKKPLGGVASGYSYSGFAVAPEGCFFRRIGLFPQTPMA